MHIFFSGIGGTAIGPLAIIAKQAGYDVSGSDKQDSNYIEYLRDHGVTDIHIGQSHETIAEVHTQKPIDWFVYSAAVAIEHPDSPEFEFCLAHNIRMSQRDELLNTILTDKKLQLIAIAGTHGKTTTTAMMIWVLRELGVRISWSVGAKMNFGDMGHYEPESRYFIYEADEFAHNFLAFNPAVSVITGIDWDHPDIYPTRESYLAAFKQFLSQTQHTVLWQEDLHRLDLPASDHTLVLNEQEPTINNQLTLIGQVNRLNAWEVAQTVSHLFPEHIEKTIDILNKFPGVSRRFEEIIPHLYTDYAHTPPKIRGALQMAHEVAGSKVVVIYEGLHNTRQHFIKQDLEHLFDDVQNLYIVPSYLAREDPNLELLTPDKLRMQLSSEVIDKTQTAQLNNTLKYTIRNHLQSGDLVLCLSAGGGGSLDEWLRAEFSD